jgi:hypothetical protein
VSVRRVLVAAAVCASLAACTAEPSGPQTSPRSSPPTSAPAYDASLPPAQGALLLAPDETTDLRVVDWGVVRRDVGLPGLTSDSSAADRGAFRMRIADSPVLDRPLLESVDARLRSRFGFGMDDVAWEAHWSGLGAHGWALSLGPQVDMAAVARAVHAGVGPLRGAGLRREDRLVLTGLSADGPVLGADRTWAELVPDPGEAFLVHVGCVAPASDDVRLDPLSGFSVTFGDHVATVRTDRDRDDLFARARLRDSPFGRVFRNPVADPSSGRIGYDVPRPARAVPLVRRGDLPFGVCAQGD